MITPERGVLLAGRYTLTRPLASGGMGSVWVARHRELDADVTVKFMTPALVASAEARARFEREAKVIVRLDSQHVVQVLDYGVEDDTPYMVMELLKGESLGERLTRERRLPLLFLSKLTGQIGKALRTAHEAGLVHRDLKPSNIFLAIKDEEQVVKVLDFGVAKATGQSDVEAGTESGMLLGSVHYMSPEQIRSSRTVDHRSDLWSLGVILYRALTGRLPFPGADLGDVLVRVCTDPIPLPSSIAPDLPAQVDHFFERAFARDPGQRFQSARELSDAFSGMAQGISPSGDAISVDPRVPSESSRMRPFSEDATKLEIPAGARSAPSAHGATMAPTPAVLVMEGRKPSFPPSRWPLVLALGVIALGAIAALVLLPHSEPAVAPAALANTTAVSPPALTPAPVPTPSPSALSLATSATGSASARTPARAPAPPRPPPPPRDKANEKPLVMP